MHLISIDVDIRGGAKEFELDSREEEGKEEVLDTSKWKVHLKPGNLYSYTITIENEQTGEITREHINKRHFLSVRSLDFFCKF